MPLTHRQGFTAMRKKIALSDQSRVGDDVVLDRLALPEDKGGAVVSYIAAQATPMPYHHRHAEWEFNLITRGRAAYLVDGQRVPIGVDSLLLLLPSQGHILLDRSEDFEMWIWVIRPHLIRTLTQDAAFAPWRDWLGGAPSTAQHRLIGEEATQRLSNLCARLATPANRIDAQSHMSPTHESAGLTFLTAEAWSAFLAAPDRPSGSHLHPAVQHAVNWLAAYAHTPQADDLDALAAHCHVSRPHLSRLFKDQTGQTMTDFRNRQRVDRFVARVGRGRRINLTQAAYAAGFGSYAQAYRVVKSLTGLNPRAFFRRSRPT